MEWHLSWRSRWLARPWRAGPRSGACGRRLRGGWPRYAESLAREEQSYGVSCGEPRWSDDEWEGKLELVARARPTVVSFTFGCPESAIVERLHANGIAAWCTITAPEEAKIAAAAGVDALVVQGSEAGGPQASFTDTDEAPVALLPLLRLVRGVTDLPIVAAGGIACGEG